MSIMLREDFVLDQGICMHIEQHMGEVAAYLETMIQQLQKKRINGMLGSELIYSLAVLYAQEIRLYLARHYYARRAFPIERDTWINAFSSVDTDQFKKSFKQALIMECPDASTQQKIIAYSGAVCAIQEQRGLLEYEKQMVPLLTENEYLNLDTYLTRQLNNGRIKTTRDKVCIEIG